MKLTWNWLSDYIDLSGLTPQQVANDLTHAGIPVEWMETFAPGVVGVVVGEVLATEQHPNADRLRVCRVAVGVEHALTIVCGAANVAAGQKVPVATVGAQLPGGPIGRSQLRGVESEGMICSAGELGLPVKLMAREQTEGILVLPADAPVGKPISDYLGLDDTVLELELTPNRSDCMSLRGAAYEIGALYGRTVHMPEHAVLMPAEGETLPLTVQLQTPLCSLYTAQTVTNLKLGPSPIWMQMRLLAVGVRPISNLVDITNYVMFEWGQPLHAFDYAAIAEHSLIVRQAQAGEQLFTLDAVERTLSSTMTVIADPQKVLGLAGVMGGRDSEVTGETQTVTIESALFDPLQTRRTGRALQLRSEAATRFEKGPDPDAVELALARAVQFMVELAGGRVASAPLVTGTLATSRSETGIVPVSQEKKAIAVTLKRVNEFLGCAYTREELLQVCDRLQFSTEEKGETILVTIPTRRPDLEREEDMIEEFARLLGYDRIPATEMVGPLTAGRLSSQQLLRRRLRSHLLSLGLQEVWTYSLVAETTPTRAGISRAHPLAHMGALRNPLSEDRRFLRSTMLFPLLEVAEYNSNRRAKEIRIFEIGTVFHPHQLPMSTQPAESQVLAALLSGHVQEQSPHGGNRTIDFYDVKGILESVLILVGIHEEVEWTPSSEPYLQNGQAADLHVGGIRIGIVGKLNTAVAKEYSLANVAFYMELEVDALSALASAALRVQELPRYPGVERDLALVAPIHLPVATLLGMVREAAGRELTDVAVFDIYTGEHVGQEEKSVALRLTYRAHDRTLTDEEVNESVNQVLAAAQGIGVVLRR